MRGSGVGDTAFYGGSQNVESVPMTVLQQGQMWPSPDHEAALPKLQCELTRLLQSWVGCPLIHPFKSSLCVVLGCPSWGTPQDGF